MKPKYLLSILLFAVVSLHLYAIPAKPGMHLLRQPDGTTIKAYIKGDEFAHVLVSEDGCALQKGADGYYYYAYYVAGKKVASTHRYGRNVPSDVLIASRNIPYTTLMQKAMMSRRGRRVEPVLQTKASNPTVSAVVLLAQFSDLKFSNQRQAFVEMMSKAQRYYSDQLSDFMSIKFDVGPIVTLSKGYAYYGEDDDDGHDKRAADAVAEAAKLSDSEVDFSKYDAVFMIYAGGSPADQGADDNHLWPHSWSLNAAGISVTLDGKRLDNYSIGNELRNDKNGLTMAGIGTFCHEFGHILGLADLYDVDFEDSGGSADGLWFNLSLMDGGNYNDNGNTPPNFTAVEYDQLGVGTALPLTQGLMTLEPVNQKHRFIKVDTAVKGEYFLMECRQLSGWDAYIGGSGMLVYHIDKSETPTGYSPRQEKDLTALQRWYYNEVNARPSHQCADLVEASKTDLASVFFPGRNNTHNEFTATSTPAFLDWNGFAPNFNITSIKKDGANIVLNVQGPLSLDSQEVFQDAVILNWKILAENYRGGLASVTYGMTGRPVENSVIVRPYQDGMYSYIIEGLQPNTSYDLSIAIKGKDGTVTKISAPFQTKPYYSTAYPFIYLNDVERYISGGFYKGTSIPLRIYNATDAVSVKWYFDNREISLDNTGHFKLTQSGTLKAVVDYKDGSSDIIIKKLTVK